MKKGLITLIFKAVGLGLSIGAGVLFVMEKVSDHEALRLTIFAVIASTRRSVRFLFRW